jgi:hypothetical protein
MPRDSGLGSRDYSMQQAPGLRESPQVEGPAPQAAVAEAPELVYVRGEPAEKTESCCARLRPWQLGHAAWREPMISASKGWLQSLQMYSKMGIVNCVHNSQKRLTVLFRCIFDYKCPREHPATP